MICVDNIVIYICIPFTLVGVCSTIAYLCSKKEFNNNNSINAHEIVLE